MFFNKNYRIVHLSKYYPPNPGGIETHVQTLAQSQAAFGADVHVVCVNGFDEKGQPSMRTKTVHEKDGNVHVTRLGRIASVARFDVCPQLPSTLLKLVRQPNTLLHLHTPNPTMLTALTMLPMQVPLVITHHSDIIKQRILKYALRPFEYLVYNQAVRILTTSPQYLVGSKFLQIYENKVSNLPLGLDCSSYITPSPEAMAYSRSLKEQHGELLWLGVGRLVYYKAFHVAIAALKKVPGKLLMVGVGPLEEELKNQAKELGVEDRIVWLGRVTQNELVGAYHAAKALWFSSNVRSEGFGLVQVEAMASNCPVINANIPCSGVSWVSRNNIEGLTIPINDADALARAAKQLLSEPGLHQRLATASRKRAEYFNDKSMAERSFQIYEQAINTESDYILIPERGNI